MQLQKRIEELSVDQDSVQDILLRSKLQERVFRNGWVLGGSPYLQKRPGLLSDSFSRKQLQVGFPSWSIIVITTIVITPRPQVPGAKVSLQFVTFAPPLTEIRQHMETKHSVPSSQLAWTPLDGLGMGASQLWVLTVLESLSMVAHICDASTQEGS